MVSRYKMSFDKNVFWKNLTIVIVIVSFLGYLTKPTHSVMPTIIYMVLILSLSLVIFLSAFYSTVILGVYSRGRIVVPDIALKLKIPLVKLNSLERYESNSYEIRGMKGEKIFEPFFYFQKNNILKIYRVTKKSEIETIKAKNELQKKNFQNSRNHNLPETFYVDNLDNIICIQFKSPLKPKIKRNLFNGFVQKKFVEMNKIYISVKNPDQLIRDLKS